MDHLNKWSTVNHTICTIILLCCGHFEIIGFTSHLSPLLPLTLSSSSPAVTVISSLQQSSHPPPPPLFSSSATNGIRFRHRHPQTPPPRSTVKISKKKYGERTATFSVITPALVPIFHCGIRAKTCTFWDSLLLMCPIKGIIVTLPPKAVTTSSSTATTS